MSVTYEQVKSGWDQAAAGENVNAAIHPSGLGELIDYVESGVGAAQQVIDDIKQYADADSLAESSIIEYGCGNGRIAIPLSRNFKRLYAVDCSYSMLQKLPRDTDSEIIPVLANDNWFGLADPADYAYSINVFIHNTYESGMQIMKAISDNLKPVGLALLQIPIYDVAKEPENWTDVGVWTSQQFRTATELSGFEIVQMHDNPGSFSFEKIGKNHHCLQVLRKL